MKRLIAFVLLATFCLPLTGCDDFSENAYKVLKASDVAYQGIMNSAAMAYRQEFISKVKLERVTHYATIYHASWKTATTILEEYETADKAGDETKKSNARKALETTLALMSNHLSELQTYWQETRDSYNKLKEGSNG